jgi:hypothetical protein
MIFSARMGPFLTGVVLMERRTARSGYVEGRRLRFHNRRDPILFVRQSGAMRLKGNCN